MSNPNATKESLEVVITSPDEVIWQGSATSLSAENSAGSFDVLPEHANFVTIVKENSPITVRGTDGHSSHFSYKMAVVAVKAGKAYVYADL